MSILANLTLAPRDPILGLTESFVADSRPGKVNLGVGVYLGEDGKVPLLDLSLIHISTSPLGGAGSPTPREEPPWLRS